MLLMFLAAAVSPLNACIIAVRNDLPAAARDCRVPFETLKPGADASDPLSYLPADSLSAACRAAMRSGQKAGFIGPGAPIVIRKGLVREFEGKLADCQKSADSLTSLNESPEGNKMQSI